MVLRHTVGPAEIPGGDRTFKVKLNTDITQYAAVIQSSAKDDEIDMPGEAGQPSWGISQESCDYSEGQHHVTVRTLGFSLALAFDGNISAGDLLTIKDTSGRVGTVGNEQYVIAKACHASAAQDDLIVVQVMPSNYSTPAG